VGVGSDAAEDGVPVAGGDEVEEGGEVWVSVLTGGAWGVGVGGWGRSA